MVDVPVVLSTLRNCLRARSEPLCVSRKSVERRRRLGWELGAPFPIKPKGMHWRRWERLVAEYSAAAKAAHVALEKWVDEMDW